LGLIQWPEDSMKTLSLLAFSVLALSLLAGCSTTNTDSACGCLPANCCSWDFYKECDLIEGKASQCPDMYGQVNCQPGVVVSRCYAVPADQPADQPAAPADVAPVEQDVPGDALPPAETTAAEPIADFGLPPAGR
jgi:hypothetical protein